MTHKQDCSNKFNLLKTIATRGGVISMLIIGKTKTSSCQNLNYLDDLKIILQVLN